MSNFELLEDGVRLDGTVLTFAELGTQIPFFKVILTLHMQ